MYPWHGSQQSPHSGGPGSSRRRTGGRWGAPGAPSAQPGGHGGLSFITLKLERFYLFGCEHPAVASTRTGRWGGQGPAVQGLGQKCVPAWRTLYSLAGGCRLGFITELASRGGRKCLKLVSTVWHYSLGDQAIHTLLGNMFKKYLKTKITSIDSI